jgi:hypothetical protein
MPLLIVPQCMDFFSPCSLYLPLLPEVYLLNDCYCMLIADTTNSRGFAVNVHQQLTTLSHRTLANIIKYHVRDQRTFRFNPYTLVVPTLSFLLPIMDSERHPGSSGLRAGEQKLVKMRLVDDT